MDRTNRTVAFALLALSMVAAICNIRLVRASGPIYIRANGDVDPPEAPIQRNGGLYALTGNITSSADGIVIEKDSITIDGHGYTVQGGAIGNAFYVYGVNNVTIRNTRTRGFNYGIYLESTSRNTIHGNDIAENTYDGISLYDAPDNAISFNNIEDNGWSAIGLYYSSGNNISGNYMQGNYFGINILTSQNSSIFHNDFVTNTNQTSSDNSPNAWDSGYPSGGNYWSDYNGADVKKGPNQDQPGSDGIGDTPYSCDENNTDTYPLIQPWTNTAVTGVLPSKTSVGQGYRVYINVTVQNQGWSPQTTELTVRANTTIISTITNIALPATSEVTLNITWQTSGVAKGNYLINATITAASNEPDTRDNTRISSLSVVVTVPGDITGNGVADIYDAIKLSNAFLSVPGDSNWNANADINSDNNVDIYDAIILSNNFGKAA